MSSSSSTAPPSSSSSSSSSSDAPPSFWTAIPPANAEEIRAAQDRLTNAEFWVRHYQNLLGNANNDLKYAKNCLRDAHEEEKEARRAFRSEEATRKQTSRPFGVPPRGMTKAELELNVVRLKAQCEPAAASLALAKTALDAAEVANATVVPQLTEALKIAQDALTAAQAEFTRITLVKSPVGDKGWGEGGGTTTTTTTTNSQMRKGAGNVGRKRLTEIAALYPDTTTKKALGVDALLWVEPFEMLSLSDRSHARRVTVNGRDLVAKIVDFHGVPKHYKEWPKELLYNLEWNEVRAYHHLKALQGLVVPQFLYHGSDLNQLWATAVTTYGGVSLRSLVGGEEGRVPLPPGTKSRTLAALRAIHDKGVIHGDVALRNVVRRERDGAVLWVDLENALIRGEDLNEEEFVRRTKEEEAELQALLYDVPESEAEESDAEPIAKRLRPRYTLRRP